MEDKKVAVPKVINKVNEYKSSQLKMLKSKCLYMYETGKPFVLTRTGGSYQLESNLFNTRAIRSGFSSYDASFIKRVKNYVIKNDVAAKFIKTDYVAGNILYIDVKEFTEGEIISGLIEIDIDRAYWETAYLLGVIDKVIYKAGLKVDKKVRLAALGSLAKRTERWVYNGKVMKKGEDDRSYLTENIWFAICKRVSDVMREAMTEAGEDFVFYWVDGIYIKNNPEAMARIMQLFNKWGYESKCRNILEILFNNHGFVVQGVVLDDKRYFSYPAIRKCPTLKKYNEDVRLKELAKEIFLK